MANPAIDPYTPENVFFREYFSGGLNGKLVPTAKLKDLSARINAELFADKKDYSISTPPEPPFLLFLGGGNGAGKTTLAFYLRDRETNPIPAKDNPSTFYMQNSSFSKRIPENSNPGDSFLLDNGGDYVVMYLQKQAVKEAIRRKLTVIGDHQMTFLEDIGEITATAKQHGYSTALIGIVLDPPTYYERTGQRQETVNRPVNHEHHFRKHIMFARNLCAFESDPDCRLNGQRIVPVEDASQHDTNHFLRMFDEVTILDNTTAGEPSSTHDLAMHQVLTSRKLPGGCCDVTVHDQKSYQMLRKLAVMDLSEALCADNAQETLEKWHNTDSPQVGTVIPYHAIPRAGTEKGSFID